MANYHRRLLLSAGFLIAPTSTRVGAFSPATVESTRWSLFGAVGADGESAPTPTNAELKADLLKRIDTLVIQRIAA